MPTRTRRRANRRTASPSIYVPPDPPTARDELDRLVPVVVQAGVLLAFRAEADSAESREQAIRAAADPVRHLDWAEQIAASVASQYGVFGSREDVAGAAAVKLVELARRFDPPPSCAGLDALVNAFRGWAWRDVKTCCQREAERLLNGGTYHERRRVIGQPLIYVESLSCLPTDRDEDGEDVPLECTRDPNSGTWCERRKSA